MATYTVYLNGPQFTGMEPNEDYTAWSCRVFSYAVCYDAEGTPVSPWGMPEQAYAMNLMYSVETVNGSDTTQTLRAKLAGVLRDQYAPTVQASDTVRVVWLDSGVVSNI